MTLQKFKELLIKLENSFDQGSFNTFRAEKVRKRQPFENARYNLICSADWFPDSVSESIDIIIEGLYRIGSEEFVNKIHVICIENYAKYLKEIENRKSDIIKIRS